MLSVQARSLILALIATLLLTVSALAASCGGEEALTLEEYFQQVEALKATAEERATEFEDAFDAELDAAASEEERLAVLEDNFTNIQPIFTAFVDGLNDLAPPAAVEELHKEYVDASAEFLASIEEVFSGLSDLEPAAGLESLFEDTDLDQAGVRFVETCAALQDIADENEIDVDLDCED